MFNYHREADRNDDTNVVNNLCMSVGRGFGYGFIMATSVGLGSLCRDQHNSTENKSFGVNILAVLIGGTMMGIMAEFIYYYSNRYFNCVPSDASSLREKIVYYTCGGILALIAYFYASLVGAAMLQSKIEYKNVIIDQLIGSAIISAGFLTVVGCVVGYKKCRSTFFDHASSSSEPRRSVRESLLPA